MYELDYNYNCITKPSIFIYFIMIMSIYKWKFRSGILHFYHAPSRNQASILFSYRHLPAQESTDTNIILTSMRVKMNVQARAMCTCRANNTLYCFCTGPSMNKFYISLDKGYTKVICLPRKSKVILSSIRYRPGPTFDSEFVT